MNNLIIPLSILIPSLIILTHWTIPGFIQKYYILKELTPFEITINNWILGGIIGIFLLYLASTINNKFKFFDKTHFNYNLKKNINYYYLFFGLLFFGILSTLSYYYLLKSANISKITAYLNPINIILIALLSKFCFNEHISNGSCFGILVIIIGLFIMYYYEK